jgi:VCBS repeat-containing protein
MAFAAAARRLASLLVFFPLGGLAAAAQGPGYGSLPLRFEPNVGQMDARALFRSQAAGHDLFLTADEAVIAVRGAAAPLRIRLLGSRPPRGIAGENRLPGSTHYYLGNDPGRWRTHVSAYGRVRYEQVYPGIDLVYYGSGRQLEYDFVVAPGADASAIAWEIDGADGVRLSADGELVLASGPGEIRQRRPLLYQEVDGVRQPVDGGYVLRGTQVGFEIGPYDRTRPLVIDPVITLGYSTYFGGSSHENSIYSGIAVDAEGAAYIVGNTFSVDLPGAAPGSKPGGTSGDVFVAKINPAGDAIEYAVYLGGTRDEEGHDIAIDPAGNAYIVGFVHQPGTGFPILNAFQPTLSGGLGDAIVAKFNPDGTLFYSSFLGGKGAGIDNSYERAHAVAADELGHLYVTGATTSTINFPIVGGVQSTNKGGFDFFVTKVAPTGLSLVFSTYIGGTLSDLGYDIALDAEHNVYVVGNTRSIDNPATPSTNEGMPVVSAFQTAHGGGTSDAFVLKLAAAGNQLLFATYLGGTGNESDDGTSVAPTGGIAVDAQGYVYVGGHTTSANFPTTPNRIQPYTGSQDLFVTKLAPKGNQLVYSTFLGGAGVLDVSLGLAVDARGSAYVAGWSGPNFPRVNALPPAPGLPTSNLGVKNDGVVAKLTPDGGALVYSTFVGGGMREVLHDIALDGSGNAYVTGVTYSGTYPLVNALDPSCPGCVDGFFEGVPDAFVAKLFLENAAPVAHADAYGTNEDVALDVPAPGVLGNDSDVNPQDVPVAILVAAPQHGSLALNADGSFTYTPAPDFDGADSFSYKASDGLLESGPAVVTLTITGTNDAPLADAGGPYSVDEGGTLALTGTATDPEQGVLTFDWDLDGDGSFETPGQTVSLSAGDGPATRTVFVRATDPEGAPGMDSATVTIRNVAPGAAGDAFATDEDAPLSVAAPGLLANDTDFDPLTAVLAAGPAHGTLTLHADGSFAYTPEANFNGADTFTYRASDGVDESAPATVTVTVTSVNDAPAAEAGGPYAVDEGAALTLAGSGTDVEPGTLSFAWDLDGDGEFDDATGPSAAYTAGNGPAVATVALRVTDAQGGSHVDAASIEIRNVAPVAQADAYTTPADSTLTVAAPGVLGNDQDLDPLTAVVASGPTQGTLTLGANGSFQYVPGPGATGTDTFTYRASDGVAQSAPATVTITLTAPQNAPHAANDTFTIKKRRHRPHLLNVLGNDSAGPGGGTLRIVALTQPQHGQVGIAPGGRAVIFQAPRRFRGTVTFTYTVRNSNGLTDTALVTVHVRRRGPHTDDDDDPDDDHHDGD